MQNAGKMQPLPVFVVIMDEVLIARDIEMIISDMTPDAAFVIARSLSEAVARAPFGPITAAFVQGDLARFKVSPIGARMSDDGGVVILVGQEPGWAPDGVAVLPFPFTRGDVAALISTVMAPV
jgi:hypothetical protein